MADISCLDTAHSFVTLTGLDKIDEAILDDRLAQAKAKAAAAYDAASDHFDDAPLSFWDRVGRRTVEGLALPSDGSVLDVGCGTGASVLPAARVVGPNGL